MDPENIFIEWLKVRGEIKNTGWRMPKHWDKIKQRKDWPQFERMASSSSSNLSLVDISDFFRANFEMRGGRFIPHQFFQKTSMLNYSRWKRLPQALPEIKQVRTSLQFIVGYCNDNNMKPTQYFLDSSAYPVFLRHLYSKKLHRWVFAYYIQKCVDNRLSYIPTDVIEHAMEKDYDDFTDDIVIWWMQLLADSKAYSLIEKFFMRMV